MRRVALVLTLGVLGLACGHAGAATPLLPSGDPFYVYSGSLANVAPGAVLRTRQVSVADLGIPTPISATQLLYRTTGELGQPTVTVATVIKALLPLGRTRIVSYQTAYDALGPMCDPSYTLQGGNASYQSAEVEENVILAYLALGDTVVTSDYEGETLDYGAGQESGYGTLDGIRAAENLVHAPASTPVGMFGYSGGAIATEYASELAPKYAPDLHIVGTAEGGIAVDYAHNLAYINGSPSWSGVIPAILVGVTRALHIDLAQYMSPYGIQLVNQVSDECINSFVGAYPGLTYDKLAKPQYQHIFDIPIFVKSINLMIMGTDGTPAEPLLMGNGNADGTGDGVMVWRDVEELAHIYCQRGVPVELTIYKGADHIEAAVPFELAALSFLTDRLNGESVPNECSSIGPGNALIPLPLPTVSIPDLRYRYVGRERHARGIVISLRTTTGSLTAVTVRLRRGRHVLDTVHIRTVGTRARRVVLRVRGRIPSTGRYTVSVSQGRTTLITRTLRVRGRAAAK